MFKASYLAKYFLPASSFNKHRCTYALYRSLKNEYRTAQIGFSEFHTSIQVYKRRKTAEERKLDKALHFPPKAKGEIINVWRDITAAELCQIMQKDMDYIRQIFLDEVKTPNTIINDIKLLQQAIKRSGRRMQIVGKPKDVEAEVDKDIYPRPPADPSKLKPRPPVVTVMGHVDHGKTTLLDALRHSRVVDQEFGGITQHVGAFSVEVGTGNKITFLDTPGHAAFTAMRARGANITDIVVLVVAADDGVMEQTVESVKMARQANVPILVAINKIDSPKANVQRAQNMLVEIGIQVEQLGGDVQAIPISALKKKNLDQLTEALILQAELLEIKADPTGPVEAVVVDSKVHLHRGRLCTVVVQRGTLKPGAILVAGKAFAKVRLLRDSEGNVIKSAGPGEPVEIEGWKDLPAAGEQVLEVDVEKKAREVIKAREDKEMQKKGEEDLGAITEKMEQHRREYEERLQHKRKLGRYKLRPDGPRKPEISKDDGEISLNVIVKGDVDGTVEAILDVLETYDEPECQLDLINYGVGAITESDVELAHTFKGVIYAFNIPCPPKVQEKADLLQVPIKHHNVIYKLVEDVKDEVNIRLPPVEVEETIGVATVLQQFDVNEGKKKVPVAGCRCTKGMLKRSGNYKLVRNGQTIFTGNLISMRHLKNEVDVIKTDLECGLQLSDREVMFKQGDSIICFVKKKEPKTTKWDPGF